MFNIQRQREKAMAGVVAPVIAARSLGADVLADVAARYGVAVSADARAVLVPTGAHAETYAVNAAGQLVWVQAQLAVDDVLARDAGPVGYFEARRKAASSQIKRRAVRTVQASGRSGLTYEARVARDAERLARVREMISLGHIRADIMQALGMSHGALQLLTSGLGLVWPRAQVVKKAVKKVRVQAVRAPEDKPPAGRTHGATRARIAALHADGVQSYAGLIAATGLCRSSVARHLQALGLTLKPAARMRQAAQRAARLDRVRSYHADGRTVEQIALLVGRSHRQVSEALRACGLVPRWQADVLRDETGMARQDAIDRAAQICALHAEGKTVEAIAAAVGLSCQTVSDRLRMAGLAPFWAVDAARAARLAEFRGLVAQGLAGAAIAEKMNVTPHVVWHMASRCKVALRRHSAEVDERRAKVAQMVADGLTHVQMRAALNIKKSTLCADIKAVGAAGKSPYHKRASLAKRHPEKVAQAMGLQGAGRSQRQIAKAMGLFLHEVKHLLREGKKAQAVDAGQQVAA